VGYSLSREAFRERVFPAVWREFFSILCKTVSPTDTPCHYGLSFDSWSSVLSEGWQVIYASLIDANWEYQQCAIGFEKHSAASNPAAVLGPEISSVAKQYVPVLKVLLGVFIASVNRYHLWRL
jgi:hypothetical protein